MKFFRRYHRWVGIFISFFLIMFVCSGIVMNHRKMFSETDIPRSLLPKNYHYNNWNNASVKGSIKINPDSILLYGGAGIWLTDSLCTKFEKFTDGFRQGADNQIVCRVVKSESNNIFSATTFDFYQLDNKNKVWKNKTDLLGINERISDIEIKGDTLIILSRSYLYYSVAPYSCFERIEIKKPDDYIAETGLFRTLWLLHSGELFGTGGKIVVDFLGLLSVFLSITGIIYFVFPTIIKRKKKKQREAKLAVHLTRKSFYWHNKVGSCFLVFFIVIILSGMFLRPPLLISIIKSKIPNIPYTTLSNLNVWNDKLRTIRYDDIQQKWLVYTSSGFYSLSKLTSVPQKITYSPPVSVMGINVMERMGNRWLIGSFSGFFLWDTTTGQSIDCFTGKPSVRQSGRPFASNPINGYSGDFMKPIVFEYEIGAYSFDGDINFLPMPDKVKDEAMSLWHLSLEIHTARLYTALLGGASDLYLFIFGITILVVYISGYIVYRTKYKKR